jgi:hypothetical protein
MRTSERHNDLTLRHPAGWESLMRAESIMMNDGPALVSLPKNDLQLGNAR